MKNFVAMHHHRHGTSVFLFQSETNWQGQKSLKDPEHNCLVLMDYLGIDYEPDREEWIEVLDIDVTNLPTVP